MDEDLLLVHSDGKSDDKQSWKNGTNRNIIRNKVDEKSTDLNDEEFRDGEEEEYEIEEILNAKKGYFPDGRMGYFVKWKGFNSSENSWVDEHDAGNAKALIEEFWKRKTPKKPQKSVTFNLDQDESASTVVTKKHTRKSQGTIEYIISDSERSKAKKIGATAVHDKDSFPLEDEVGISGDMSAYLSVPSWEHLVDTVDTVERAPDGTLNIYFTVKGGERVMTSSECCSQRFPRKLIEFYESNLKWESVTDNGVSGDE